MQIRDGEYFFQFETDGSKVDCELTVGDSKPFFEKLSLKIDADEFELMRASVASNRHGKFGKASGFSRQYIEVIPHAVGTKLTFNRWFLLFGANLEGQLSQEACQKFGSIDAGRT